MSRHCLHHFDTFEHRHGPPAHHYSACTSHAVCLNWMAMFRVHWCKTAWWACARVIVARKVLQAMSHACTTLTLWCKSATVLARPFAHTTRVHMPTKQFGTPCGRNVGETVRAKPHANAALFAVTRRCTVTLPSVLERSCKQVSTLLARPFEHFGSVAVRLRATARVHSAAALRPARFGDPVPTIRM